MAKKVNYSIGDCFSIPLRNGGYARGVILRMNGDGVVFGYFFKPKFDNKDDLVVIQASEMGDYILAGQFGDLGLLNGEWKLLGCVEELDPLDFPLPKFLRVDSDGVTGFLSKYNDLTLDFEGEEKIDVSRLDKNQFLADVLMGYGSVEIKLTKLLD